MENHGELWNSTIIHMVQMLYEDSECAVLDKGEESEWFEVKNRQNRVIMLHTHANKGN